MKKILFDSNILISAMLNPKGTPAQSLQKARRFHRVFLCAQTLDEIERFSRKKSAKRILNFQRDFLVMKSYAEIIPAPDEKIELEREIRDETDRPILRAAVAEEIDIIITGDLDFTESGIETPLILTPAQFLNGDF